MTPRVLKLQFKCGRDAEGAALYLADRGYTVRQLGTAVVSEWPDAADLAVCQVTFSGYTDDPTEWDKINLRAGA